MVRDLVIENNLDQPEGKRCLNAAGLQAVYATAEKIAALVDELLDKRWNRRSGEFIEAETIQVIQHTGGETDKVATCSCGSGIPIQKVNIEGQVITLVGLPLIFQQFREAGKAPDVSTLGEMMDTVKVYNPIPVEAEPAYSEAILGEYRVFWGKETGR
jgi:hypothetical protein